MRDLIESADRVDGYRCPHCGGPLVWIHSKRYSPAAGEDTYQRDYLLFRDTRRRTKADREVDVPTSRSGREVRTETLYERRLEFVCPHCHVIMSRQQAASGNPR